MVKMNEEQLVSIELPRLVVKKADAEYYLQVFNKFASDIRNCLVTDLVEDEHIFDFNNSYINGSFIPVVEYKTSFSGILNNFIPQVNQLDKFVAIEKPCYECDKQEIFDLWNYSKEEQGQE